MTESLFKKKTLIKNVIFWLIEALIGLGVIWVVFIALNYFNLFPDFINNTKIINSLPRREPAIEEKAREMGYEILWKGESEDGSGRAVLISKERNFDGWVDKFGIQKGAANNGKEIYSYKSIGVFIDFNDISDSNDMYLSYKIPGRKTIFKTRILSDSSSLSMNGKWLTNFWIDDLSASTTSKRWESLVSLGTLRDGKIKKLLKKGDIVEIIFMLELAGSSNELSITAKKDNNEVFLADDVFIRRFNAKYIELIK